jgi:hypothetical protein
MRMFGIDFETTFTARTREGKTTLLAEMAEARGAHAVELLAAQRRHVRALGGCGCFHPRCLHCYPEAPERVSAWPPPEKQLARPCGCGTDPAVFGHDCGG